MTIDAHVHLSTYTSKGNSLEDCLNILLREMKQNNIDYAIVIPDDIEDDPKIADLENTLKLVNKTNKLFALGSPQIMQRGNSELDKYRSLFEDGKIHGLKLFPGHEAYYPNDERCHPYFQLLQELGYPLVIHTGDHSQDPTITNPLEYTNPKYIVEIAKMFPKLKVIITHYYWPKLDYCYEITKDIPNIYFEIAALADKEVLDASGGVEKMRIILKQTISDRPDKVIFGTDWPLCDYENTSGFAHHIELINSLELSEEEKERIFSQNAIEVYNLKI